MTFLILLFFFRLLFHLSISVLVGACLATFLFTAFCEGLKMFRQWLVSRPLSLMIRELTQSTSTSEDDDIPDTETAFTNTDRLQKRVARFPRRRWLSFTVTTRMILLFYRSRRFLSFYISSFFSYCKLAWKTPPECVQRNTGNFEDF